MTVGQRYFAIMGNLDWCFKHIKHRRLLPLYKNSIEACCGAGELIWNTKPPLGLETLNDIDPDIIRMHVIVKHLTLEELEILRRLNWTLDEKHFYHLRDDYKPETDFQFLYRRLYLYTARKRANDVDHDYFLPNFQGDIRNPTPRLWEAHNRLKNVQLSNLDALAIIKKHEDDKDTFLFLDPPYPARDRYYAYCTLRWDKLYTLLSKSKHKWMLVSSKRYTKRDLDSLKMNKDMFIWAYRTMEKLIKNFNSLKITEKARFASMFKNTKFPDKEYYIIWNYDIHNFGGLLNAM